VTTFLVFLTAFLAAGFVVLDWDLSAFLAMETTYYGKFSNLLFIIP
jgi:hypothetical protein